MASRIGEFPMAWEFPKAWEVPVTREFPRLKLFPPVSREMGISREFPARGFPLSIAAPIGVTGTWYWCPIVNYPGTVGCCSCLPVAGTENTVVGALPDASTTAYIPDIPSAAAEAPSCQSANTCSNTLVNG